MLRRSLTAFVAALAVAGLAGCGSSHGGDPTAAGSRGPGANTSRTPAPGATASASGRAPGGSGANGQPSSSVAPSGPSGPSGNASPSASPSHNFQATPEELPIRAAVTPSCVPAGSVAKLTVHTVAKAAIAFVAVYKGEKSGAAPPWGEGYGGNDKGTASSGGDWSSSWTVAPNTPQGPARVILVVGSNGKQRQINVPFAVGAVAGGCGA